MTNRVWLAWINVLLIAGVAGSALAQSAAPPRAAPSTRSSTRPVTTRPAASKPVAIRPLPAIGRATTLPAAVLKPLPETIEDLKALQQQVRDVVTAVSPTVVGLRVGGGLGSGVIITNDGYVLTAAHVSGSPGRNVVVILPDGKQVTGKSLGANNSMDAGLIQITDEGPLPGGKWPSAPMASSTMLKTGQWCVALGHPGGFRTGRTPPLRLGRVLELRANAVRTDCTLVGGDSGGPLFDLHGRVIGIHSRIGGSLAENLHVPVDVYRLGWTRLASAEEWGEAFWRRRSTPAQPASYLGVSIDPSAGNCLVLDVSDDSPAQPAGLLKGGAIRLFGT